MSDAFLIGICSLFKLKLLILIISGVIIGLIVGVIPGISGLTAITMILPLIYNMDPIPGLCLLISICAASKTGGTITAVLLNIPGDAINAATLLDGYPMTKSGFAGKGIGAALTASMAAGIFSGILLAAFIPIIEPLVLAFGSPETFAFIVVGILCLGMLLGKSKIKGLLAGFFGMIVGFVGWDPIDAIPRYTFNSDRLLDGFDLVSVTLGIFVIPQIIDLIVETEMVEQIKEQVGDKISGVFDGMKDVFRHWSIFLRSSIIGVIIGILPGIGGTSAGFIAYAQARQTSKYPEKFGTGIVEGVIAAESGISSELGGAIMPTLAFGVPGNLVMAVMMGAFQIKGIPFSTGLFRNHLDLVWAIVGCLILSSFVAGMIALMLSRQIVKMCFVPGYIMAPMILSLCAAAAYGNKLSFFEIVVMVVFGLIGYIMARFDYPRAAFLIGFVLTPMAERFFHLSMDSYGLTFLYRPVVLATFVLLGLSLFYNQIKNLTLRLKRKI